MVGVILLPSTMQRLYRSHTEGDINISQWDADEQTSLQWQSYGCVYKRFISICTRTEFLSLQKSKILLAGIQENFPMQNK